MTFLRHSLPWLVLAMYLPIIYFVRDLNVEALTTTLVFGYAEEAVHKGVNALHYFENDEKFLQYKLEDPSGAYQAYQGGFLFSYQLTVCPFSVLLGVPLVKWLGVTCFTVTSYSVLFALLTLWAVYRYTLWKYLDEKTAFTATWVMAASLMFLIHTAVSYPNMVPAVLLMVLMVWCLDLYSDPYLVCRKMKYLFGAGIFLGLQASIGWIGPVIAGAFVAGHLIQVPGERFRRTVWLGITSLSTLLVVLQITAWYYNLSLDSVIYGWFYPMLYRGGENPIGGYNPSIREKIQYFINAFFLNSRQLDHPDKYLEGHCILPPLVYLLGIYGFVKSFQQKATRGTEKTLLLWVSLGILFVLYFGYAHRYLLVCLPAFAILAARGQHYLAEHVKQDIQRWAFSWVITILLLVSGVQSVKLFYVDYLQYKPRTLDINRYRGFSDLTHWMGDQKGMTNAWVVLGDPTMISPINFQFYTFGKNYSHLYWNWLTKRLDTPVKLLDWETEQQKVRPTIAYVFTTETITDGVTGRGLYDIRNLLATHPYCTVNFSYHYGTNPVSMYVVLVTPNETQQRKKELCPPEPSTSLESSTPSLDKGSIFAR